MQIHNKLLNELVGVDNIINNLGFHHEINWKVYPHMTNKYLTELKQLSPFNPQIIVTGFIFLNYYMNLSFFVLLMNS